MVNLLKILKWILLPFTIAVFLLFVNAATDSTGISSDEEGLMYGAWILVIVNVCLFVFNKKWQKTIDNRMQQNTLSSKSFSHHDGLL